MKNLYYAAFIPGLQNIIENVIKERLSDVKIHKLLDGAVVFETQTSYDKLNFFCFNNIFAVINILEHSENKYEHGADVLEKHIKLFINGNNNFNNDVIINNSKNFKTFRIVVSRENVPASINENLRTMAEKTISGLNGLKVNRALPGTEFWFLYRSEEKSHGQNFSVFMKRLTFHASLEKTLHKGELPPPLAWTLCRLASLSFNDTVLDPFCGYGSIPQAAAKYFHITNFTGCDIDKKAVLYTKAKLKKRKDSNIFIYNNDFRELPVLLEKRGITHIDAIVTDPPWGLFKEIKDDAFLKKMFDIFAKLLKDGGRAVVLYPNDDNFLKVSDADFTLQTNIPILLSGKKAVIYVFVKKEIKS